MAKILTIGSVTKDMFFPVQEAVVLDTPEDLTAKKKIAFELGAKYDIRKRYETLGGCSVNVACGLARLGEDANCYVGIGNDDCGEWIMKNISKETIGVENVVTIKGEVSDLSAIVIDEKSGERTIFSSHGASRKFEVQADKISGCDWIFVGDLSGSWKENLEVILAKAKENEIKIAFNPRQQMLHEDAAKVASMLFSCDLLFLNKDETVEIILGMGLRCSETEMDDEIFLLRKMKEAGAGIVVITDGERGAWAYDGDEMFHVQAILGGDVLDTTGAGDAFASGFFASLVKGGTISKSLSWGITNSTSCIKKYGGQEGLLTFEMMESASKNISVQLIG